MTIYLSTHTGLETDTILDDAENITVPATSADLDVSVGKVKNVTSLNAANSPTSNAGIVEHFGTSATSRQHQVFHDLSANKMFIRRFEGSWSDWQELYHTGNVGNVQFNVTPADGESAVSFNSDNGVNMTSSVSTTSLINHVTFQNPNGNVGSIQSTGSATAYNTSSDPRLKSFKDLPSDELIDIEFDKVFACFRVFNWNADPEGDLVWGFDAHECIDKQTNIGSEGKGPRNLKIGEVYDTTPAVFEDQEQQVVYKSGPKIGQPRFDSEGDAIMETIAVEVAAAIEHKVSPAGVDQSKAVPILLAKIEQLERRLTAAGL